MDSGCYVYAIVERDTPLPAGVTADAELSMVPWRDLAAVTGRIGHETTAVTVEAVLRHEGVVESVRRLGRALPVRFGTVFRDATSVASALAERYEPLRADLERLGDKVELSLTALWAEPPLGDGATAASIDDGTPVVTQRAGAGYLRARAAELRRDEALKERARTVARQLDEILGGLALDQRTSLLPTPRIVLRASYLLDPAGTTAFRAGVEGFRGKGEQLRVLLTGPWPPYSFTGRTQAGDGAASDGRLSALVQRLTDAMQGRPG